MLVDWKGHLWSYGENSKGNLGTGDTKKKLSPLSVPFFSNKRVIDVACGDRFSVVIAEVYNIDKDEEAAYFEQKDLSNLQAFFSNDLYENIDNSNGKKPKLISTKMHVETARPSICQSQQGNLSRTLKDKISDLIGSRQSKVQSKLSLPSLPRKKNNSQLFDLKKRSQ